MKKSLLALAALGAFAGVAHAQSSVTLYGIIDDGINYTSNTQVKSGAGRTGHNLYNLSSGELQGSRWGLRGTEDLGGGLKAIFVLENGFDVNKGTLGQGGDLFGRQAYVGLSTDKFGSITLGRQYDSVVDYVGPLEVGDQWGGYIAAHPGDLDNFNNANRVNNAIKYTSSNYAGLTFGGLYSLGGVAGQTGRNQIWSLGASYTNGPLALGAGYLNVRDPNFSLFGNNSTSSATANNIGASTTTGVQGNPVISGFATAKTYQVAGGGAAYTFGAATFGATYSNIKFMNLGADAVTGMTALQDSYRGTATFNNAEVNFKYQLTPALVLGAAYDFTKGSSINGLSAAKYNQGAIGADYFLSKRTDVYLTGIYQHASGYDSTGQEAVASINNLTPSNTNNQATVRVGIRSKF